MPNANHPTTCTQITGDTSAEDDMPQSAGIPVSPARFRQLQRNGLYGLAPERAIMRVDLQLAPYENLADVVETGLSIIPD